MSEDLRYNEMDRKFNDLPMPNEEASWQKMKELLDDDGDEIVPPPVFLKSCLGWGILLLAGLTIAWLLVGPEKWWKDPSRTNHTSSSTKKEIENSSEQPIENATQSNQYSNTEKVDKGTASSQSIQKKQRKLENNLKSNEVISVVKLKEPRQNGKNSAINNASVDNQITFFNRGKNNISKANNPGLAEEQKKDSEISAKEKTGSTNTHTIQITQENDKTTNDLVTDKKIADNRLDTVKAITNEHTEAEGDTMGYLNTDGKIDSTNQKKTDPKKKKFSLAVGVGEQQLIPIAGQTTVPYSRYGRKSSLADYVPSFFVQLQKENKWFVQTEFRYGAAQSVKEVSYNRNTKYDAISNNVTITTMRLKKTYYHQLPISFNYFLMPNLSVGIGAIYSRFYGAVTEKETTTFNTQTQTVSTIKQIIPVKQFTDSFLYKTQVHALLQADYHWKKFSFGLRYTKDVQPYIKYTRPDGTLDEEKNQSLQLIVRYRLWQSAKL